MGFPAPEVRELLLCQPTHEVAAAVFYEGLIDDIFHVIERAVGSNERAVLVAQVAPRFALAAIFFGAAAVTGFLGL